MTAATISLQDARYRDAERVQRLFADSLDRIRRQPGVEFAGVTLGLPYTRLLNMGFGRVEGATDEDKGGMANVSYVTPGYFEALRTPLRDGRFFTDADQTTTVPVAIVNEQFARRFYKDRDIRGLHIRVAGATREVVGVIGNARATSRPRNDSGPPRDHRRLRAAKRESGFFKGSTSGSRHRGSSARRAPSRAAGAIRRRSRPSIRCRSRASSYQVQSAALAQQRS